MDFIIRNENYSVFYEDMSTFIEEQDSLSLQFEIVTFYRIDMIISIMLQWFLRGGFFTYIIYTNM